MIILLARWAVALALIAIAVPASAQDLIDLSGVVIHDGSLYLVGNKSNNVYFVSPTWKERSGFFQLTPLQPQKLASTSARDLESIAVTNGEVVVLSERSSAIYSQTSRLVDYSALAVEFSRGYSQDQRLQQSQPFNNGFEGLATRLNDQETGQQIVAVLWEGGYSPEIKRVYGKDELFDPIVVQHRLTPGKAFTATNDSCTILRLPWDYLAKRPEMNLTDDSGEFTIAPRATDLVWYPHTKDGQQHWGLIVHLSCAHPKYFDRHWLCRITGCPLDDHAKCRIDIVEVSDQLEGYNWEGLCWYDSERTTLLWAADKGTSLPMFAGKLPPSLRVAP